MGLKRFIFVGAASVLVLIASPARAAQKTVMFSDTSFVPATVQLAPGDDVFWCPYGDNDKTLKHSITFDGLFTKEITPGTTSCPAAYKTFSDEGTFPYHCKYVTGMKGTIVVGSGSPPTTTATTRATSATTTATTRRATTATTVRSTASTRAASATSTSLAEETTSTTDTTEATTTSSIVSPVALEQASKDSGGSALPVLVGVLAVLAGSGGYIAYQRRRSGRWS